jgi:hypothetical protein
MDVTVRLSDSNMGLSASGEVQRGVLNELHKAVAPHRLLPSITAGRQRIAPQLRLAPSSFRILRYVVCR